MCVFFSPDRFPHFCLHCWWQNFFWVRVINWWHIAALIMEWEVRSLKNMIHTSLINVDRSSIDAPSEPQGQNHKAKIKIKTGYLSPLVSVTHTVWILKHKCIDLVFLREYTFQVVICHCCYWIIICWMIMLTCNNNKGGGACERSIVDHLSRLCHFNKLKNSLLKWHRRI